MNIFVYGDESGVFDKAHNEIFVFGGLIFLDKNSKDAANRRFIHAERCIMSKYNMAKCKGELKACHLSNKHKASLFRSTNSEIRYGHIINQGCVNDGIFGSKKSKQRYLDYVFKVGLKRQFGKLISSGAINPSDVDNVYIRFDEHTTATDGRYELREAIEEEFKYGTSNFRWNTFHKPIFPGMRGIVQLDFKDSRSDPLIRASDIIANHVLYHKVSGQEDKLEGKMFLSIFP